METVLRNEQIATRKTSFIIEIINGHLWHSWVGKLHSSLPSNENQYPQHSPDVLDKKASCFTDLVYFYAVALE